MRRAEYGRQAIGAARPRDIGLRRSRAPLVAQLYLGARAGWLVWHSPAQFALLEPPARYRARTWQAAGLRLLNGSWWALGPVFQAVLVVPPAFALALIPVTRLAGLLLLLIATILVLLMIILDWAVVFVRATWGISIILQPRMWHRDRYAADSYFAEHWSVRLCHITDPDQVARVVLALRKRAAEADMAAAPGDRGSGNSALLVRESAITMPGARAAMRSAAAAIPLSDGTSGILLFMDGRERGLPVPPRHAERGVIALLLALAASVLVDAGNVADEGGVACRAASCAGHLAMYGRALRWAASQVIFSSTPGVNPTSLLARAAGLQIRVFTIVAGAVLAANLYYYVKAQDREKHRLAEAIRNAAGHTVTLVLVANETERDAVIARVREATGGQRATRNFLTDHTVFDLGVLARSRVLLAQSEQGIEASRGMTLTASSLIRQCEPDYVILVGVCFGLREEEQRLGDVLVSSQLRNLNTKKVVETSPGVTEELPRGDYVSPGVLLDRCRAATIDWDGPPVHFGVILSEGVLVDSPERRRELKKKQRDAVGGEMEGAGVYAAAVRSNVSWIIIKGISDWGERKTDNFQEMAAASAAGFLVHVIQTGGLDQPPSPAAPGSPPGPGPGPGTAAAG